MSRFRLPFPGRAVYGKDYVYPSQNEVDYFLARGMNTIRSPGAQNLVLVPGNVYTGAGSWVNGAWYGTANGSVMTSISDPANNFAFELHQ